MRRQPADAQSSMSTREFQSGEQVVHPARPEWGTGVIRQAGRASHNGQRGQRLVIDFANRGRVTINTAVIELSNATGKEENMSITRNVKGKSGTSSTSGGASGGTSGGGGWLAELEKQVGGNGDALTALPSTLSDPFKSDEQRLHATLDIYRFSTEPRSLLEWATAQTGMNDPLTKYTRQELEQAFARFARDRDQHLKQLVFQIKRGTLNGEAVLRDAARQARVPAAREALKKAMKG
jgi:hypothetical protein